MRNILKTFVIMLSAISLIACDSDDATPSETLLDINYATTHGTWELARVNGEEIAGDAFFYITLDRTESEFNIYDSMNSGISHHSSGTFALEQDDTEGGMVISGEYANQFFQKWNNSYLVVKLTAEKMVWKTVGNDEIQEFKKVDAVPADIVAGTRCSE